MFCRKCGSKINDVDSFCINCGTKVNDSFVGDENNKGGISSNVCELEKKIKEHSSPSFESKFEYVSNVLYDLLRINGIDYLLKNLDNCTLNFVMDDMYHFNKMIFNDKKLERIDRDKYISWLSNKTNKDYIEKLCNDKRNIFNEFSDFIKDKDYDTVLSRTINFSKVPINQIELLFTFFNTLDSDNKYYNKLYNMQSESGGLVFQNEDFYNNYAEKTYTKIYKLINGILEKVYIDNKVICDKIINDINNAKIAFDERDDSWSEENIPGYEKGEFNYNSLAKSIIKSQMYTKEQVLASFYKSGNNVCTKLFFEEIDKLK